MREVLTSVSESRNSDSELLDSSVNPEFQVFNKLLSFKSSLNPPSFKFLVNPLSKITSKKIDGNLPYIFIPGRALRARKLKFKIPRV